MDMLPTFIICGTMRGGTTSLYNYLMTHPEICMSRKKEVHYFDLNYYKGVKWYEKHFEECKNGKVKAIGEASPSYMYFEEVPKRIHEFLPNVKLIFILRNPVNRVYSHYWHEVRHTQENLSFEEAIEKEEERLSQGDIFSKIHYSYKDRGKYIIQIKRFKKYFSNDQMLFLMTEDLEQSPEKVMKKIFEFLKVNTNFTDPSWNIKHNEGKIPRIRKLNKLKVKIPIQLIRGFIHYINLKDYPPMKQQTREYLINYFKPYNKELEKFLGRKLDKWNK